MFFGGIVRRDDCSNFVLRINQMVVGTGKHFKVMSVHDLVGSLAPFVEFHRDRYPKPQG